MVAKMQQNPLQMQVQAFFRIWCVLVHGHYDSQRTQLLAATVFDLPTHGRLPCHRHASFSELIVDVGVVTIQS